MSGAVMERGVVRQRSRPNWLLQQVEFARAVTEFSGLWPAQPLLRKAPKGDGHPVLVLPGMLGGDRTTLATRQFLNRAGYSAQPWSLGPNLGHKTVGASGERIIDLVDDLSAAHGGRKVSLLGWSLGGIIAREVAKQKPDLIRQVISMGSPFNRAPEGTTISWIYHVMSGEPPEPDNKKSELVAPPAGVPCTAIYSRSDGMVSWQACLEPKSELTDNIEVVSSHAGYGINAAVLFAVADRLAMPEGEWAPFDRDLSAWRRLTYPKAAWGEPR